MDFEGREEEEEGEGTVNGQHGNMPSPTMGSAHDTNHTPHPLRRVSFPQVQSTSFCQFFGPFLRVTCLALAHALFVCLFCSHSCACFYFCARACLFFPWPCRGISFTLHRRPPAAPTPALTTSSGAHIVPNCSTILCVAMNCAKLSAPAVWLTSPLTKPSTPHPTTNDSGLCHPFPPAALLLQPLDAS